MHVGRSEVRCVDTACPRGVRHEGAMIEPLTRQRARRTRWAFRLVAAPLVILALSLALARPAPASAATIPNPQDYGVIVRTALAHVDQYGGQCFPWVRSIVQAAIGRTIGFDYNLGYLEAGAVEVPLGSARDGDVIQITNPAITEPTANYPGLHTAIVMDNLGGGEFRVVDSNMNYDEMVHIREGYRPAELVTRGPGLVVRVYRFDAAPGSASTNPPAPPSTASSASSATGATVTAPGGEVPAPGASVTIAADGDCLRMRGVAGLSGTVLGCLPTGARATVTQAGPATDGYQWVQIAAGALRGWVAADYLAIGPDGPSTPAIAETSPAPVASAPAPAPRGVFATPPRFNAASGQAAAVFLGGTADELIAAAADARASGVWAQDASGAFQLLIIGGPSFMVDAFRATFAAPFPGPVAVTLVGDAG